MRTTIERVSKYAMPGDSEDRYHKQSLHKKTQQASNKQQAATSNKQQATTYKY
jgi:hypothetical protein